MPVHIPSSIRSVIVGLCLGFSSIAALAQTAAPALPEAEFSPPVSEIITARLAPLLQTEQFAQQVAVVDDMLKLVKPGTYDLMQLNWMKARMMLSLDQTNLSQVIGLLETSLGLVDQYPHFMPEVGERMSMLVILAQSLARQAGDVPPGPAQRELYGKAAAQMRRFVSESPRITPNDAQIYIVSLLNMLSDDTQKPDAALLNEAKDAIHMGLRLSLFPNPSFYQYLVSVHQMAQELEPATEYLEVLVRMLQPRQPNSQPDRLAESLWKGLANSYLQMAYSYSNDDPADGPQDLKKANDFNVRALNAYERAQRQGYLDTSTDHLNVIGTYATLGQVGLAAERLEADLRSGKVTPTDERNWSALATYYQAINKPDKVIEVMKEAASRFPNTGSFDYQISQAYLEQDKIPEALAAAREAIRKGVPPAQEGMIWLSISYYSYTLERYEDAREAINRAAANEALKPNRQAQQQIEQLKSAIDDIIARLAAAEETRKAAQ